MAQNAPEKFLSMRPATWYYREAIRRASTKRDAQDFGRMACDEIDHLKAQIRSLGYIPGRVYDPTSLLPDDDRQQDLFQERA